MTAIYDKSFRLPGSLSPSQVSWNRQYLALPSSRTSIALWDTNDLNSKPTELCGHRKTISAATFGKRSDILCSGADDYVIIWNVTKCRAAFECGEQTKGLVIGTTLGPIEHLSFKPDDSIVAACVDSLVYLLQTNEEKLVATLEGHEGLITCAEFCPHYSATLITASEDRTFKIWNTLELSLLYQSTIISASPFTSLAMHPVLEQFSLGTSDGIVRVYNIKDDTDFKPVHQLSLDICIRKWKNKELEETDSSDMGPVTVSSKPQWKRKPSNTETLPYEDEEVEVNSSILGLHYYIEKQSKANQEGASFLGGDSSVIPELFETAPKLIAGCSSGIVVLNSRTLDMVSFIDTNKPLPCNNDNIEEDCIVNNACVYSFFSNYATKTVWSLIGTMFQNVAHLVQIKPNAESATEVNGQTQDLTRENKELSVVSNCELIASSPLNSELTFKSKQPLPKGRTAQNNIRGPIGGLDKKGRIMDNQPITFKPQVRSSGYTKEQPRTTMFTPKLKTSSAKKTSASPKGKETIKEYPIDANPPTVLKETIECDTRATTVNAMSFSHDGQLLACALGNKSSQVFNMPLSGKGTSMVGHNAPVTCVNWSFDSKWLLTASDDYSGIVWSRGQNEPAMIINTVKNNFSVDKESAGVEKDNPQFKKQIKHIQFYYLDKYILIASGNTMYLFSHFLDPSKSDLKRYQTKSRYKIVKTFSMEESQGITAVSAVNSFYSYLVLCAGTNKCIEVYDLNVCKVVHRFSDTHIKAPHAIVQNEGSPFVYHPQEAYNLFLTSAVTDCIKMWDIRTNKCVQRYEGHKNRVYPCGLAISPCSRFIATGAEDKCAYIYDVRQATYLHKLGGFTETVSEVAFHPLKPILVTGTLDGKVKLFKDK